VVAVLLGLLMVGQVPQVLPRPMTDMVVLVGVVEAVMMMVQVVQVGLVVHMEEEAVVVLGVKMAITQVQGRQVAVAIVLSLQFKEIEHGQIFNYTGF
jgi:uncharacterized membrane protein